MDCEWTVSPETCLLETKSLTYPVRLNPPQVSTPSLKRMSKWSRESTL